LGKNRQIKYYSSCLGRGLEERGSKVVETYSIKNASKLTIWEITQINYYSSCLGREPQERGSKIVEKYSIKNSSKLTIWGKPDKSKITARVWGEVCSNEEAKLSKHTVLKILAN
jgi:hypothetical protein